MPAWKLENEDNDIQKWISTYIAQFTGIMDSRADLSVAELKTLRKGQRELAKWYIYWKTLFPSLPHPNPCKSPLLTNVRLLIFWLVYDRSISLLRNKQRLVEVYGYIIDSMAERRLAPSSVG